MWSFSLGAQSPGKQVSYQTITETKEMTRGRQDAVGSHRRSILPSREGQGSVLKKGAPQPKLKEEELLQ